MATNTVADVDLLMVTDDVLPAAAHFPLYRLHGVLYRLKGNRLIPMQLSTQAIQELQQIYREECGATLTDAEAQDMGQRLLALFQLLARPLPPHTPETPLHTNPPRGLDGSLDPDTLQEKG
jgi:hypothetical protein